MNKPVRFLQIFCLSCAVLCFGALDALAKVYKIDIAGDSLSADIENEPLSAVINDIGQKTGIRFVFMDDRAAAASGYNEPFSARFRSVPIRTALQKLLIKFNCSFISDPAGNIRQVFILGLKSAGGVRGRTSPPIPAPSYVPEEPESPPQASGEAGLTAEQQEPQPGSEAASAGAPTDEKAESDTPAEEGAKAEPAPAKAATEEAAEPAGAQ